MESHKNTPTFHAKTRAAWRKWLEQNHDKVSSVFLIIYRKESGVPSVYYPEAVDEAICFGWIDSKINKRDEESYYQYFAKRNPKSNWSKVNKEKVQKLSAANLLAPAGLAAIEVAKQTGTWTALDKVDAIHIPDDLRQMFTKNKAAAANFEAFPRSAKRGILEWIETAKRPETRLKRIEETVAKAAENVKANYPG